MPAESYVRPDGVGVLVLKNPPVNSLSEAHVNSLKQEFPKLANDPKVKAIVVTGDGKFFCGGADIAEFAIVAARGPPPEGAPSPVAGLSELIDMVDACPKTVVAAINGQALGGGLEMALACHYRVAAGNVTVGLPEVSLGLLPGGQGTQRLPRVAPLPVAMQMMVQGRPLKAQQALESGIVDAIAKGDVVDEAAAFALSKPPAPISQRPVPHANRFMAAAGALDQGLLMASQQARGMIAPASIIECLRAACSKKTFREGLQVEAREFTKLVFSVQSAALRHLFFAERAIQKVPGLKAEPGPIRKVGIVGAGLMGGGIAICFVEKNVPVVLKDGQQDWLDAGMKKVAGTWESQVKRGRFSADELKRRMGLITPTLRYEDFADVDMVIEAVPEIMTLKKEIFRELDRVTKPDCVLCTNTSGLDIDEIAAVLRDPSRMMGCHFFSPANVMQLLENVRTSKASMRTLATGMAMGRLINKKTVLVGNCDGFVGNRMMAPYGAESLQLLEEGATIEQIEAAAAAVGMAMGPISLGDLVGQELFWKQRKAAGDMKKQTKTYYGPYDLVDWLCEQGRFGQKTPDPKIKATGRGAFIHRGRDKVIDPEAVEKIKEIQRTKGVTPRAFTQEEIIERIFFPLINEGFKILEEGYAARPSDVDIVYIFGYGFPPAKGGPMFFAENYVGLPHLLERLKVFAAQTRERYTKNPHYLKVDYYEPSKLLELCVANKGAKVPPGSSLIEVTLREFRKKSSAVGPFSKL